MADPASWGGVAWWAAPALFIAGHSNIAPIEPAVTCAVLWKGAMRKKRISSVALIRELEALGSPPEETTPEVEENFAEAVRLHRERRFAERQSNAKVRSSPRIEDGE